MNEIKLIKTILVCVFTNQLWFELTDLVRCENIAALHSVSPLRLNSLACQPHNDSKSPLCCVPCLQSLRLCLVPVWGPAMFTRRLLSPAELIHIVLRWPGKLQISDKSTISRVDHQIATVMLHQYFWSYFEFWPCLTNMITPPFRKLKNSRDIFSK